MGSSVQGSGVRGKFATYTGATALSCIRGFGVFRTLSVRGLIVVQTNLQDSLVFTIKHLPVITLGLFFTMASIFNNIKNSENLIFQPESYFD